MNVNIESIGFKADQKLLDFIEKKMGKLVKFHEGIIDVDVKLRIEKEGSMENKVAEVLLRVPQNDLYSRRNDATFEGAIDSTHEALRKQLKKHREKQIKR